MEKQVTITKIRLDLLRYFKECREDESTKYFQGEYTSDQLQETLMWILRSGYIKDCEKRKLQLNEKGLAILNDVEEKIEEKKKNEIKITNDKWWDRFIQNGQYILNVIFGAGLLFFACLTYIQSDKNKSIIELRELRVKDSLQFSTTLHDLQNQLTRQNKQLESIRGYIQKDSLDNVLKVGQTTK